MHDVSSSFGALTGSEEMGEFCRIRIRLNVTQPLLRGVFISINNQNKVWLAFKYETLPNFYFGCGKIGHGVQECNDISLSDRMKDEDNFPYSNSLRAESKMMGKECYKFGFLSQKSRKQCCYTGEDSPNDEQEGGKPSEYSTVLGVPTMMADNLRGEEMGKSRENFGKKSMVNKFWDCEFQSNSIIDGMAVKESDNGDFKQISQLVLNTVLSINGTSQANQSHAKIDKRQG